MVDRPAHANVAERVSPVCRRPLRVEDDVPVVGASGEQHVEVITALEGLRQVPAQGQRHIGLAGLQRGHAADRLRPHVLLQPGHPGLVNAVRRSGLHVVVLEAPTEHMIAVHERLEHEGAAAQPEVAPLLVADLLNDVLRRQRSPSTVTSSLIALTIQP